MSLEIYRQSIDTAFAEIGELTNARDEIGAKLFQLHQFIFVAVKMLPETERQAYQAKLDVLASPVGNLTDSVREILKLAANEGSYLTAAEVRDQLITSGFDFSRYTSNPLSSVNTVLRRFKSNEVETRTRDGVATYRWVISAQGQDKGFIVRPAGRRQLQIED